MARLIWIAVGAAGGIYTYRKGERAVAAVREQGVAGTAQLVASAASQRIAARNAAGPAVTAPAPGVTIGRIRISRAGGPAAAAPPASPALAGGVVEITDAKHPVALRGRPAR